MPKTGLSAAEWRKRLKAYAKGSFTFGTGLRPPKGSSRATEVAQIEQCPLHRNRSSMDPFGRKLDCTCGFHKAAPPRVSRHFPPVGGRGALTLSPPVGGRGAPTLDPPVGGRGALTLSPVCGTPTLTPPVGGRGALTLSPVCGTPTLTPPVGGRGALTLSPVCGTPTPLPVTSSSSRDGDDGPSSSHLSDEPPAKKARLNTEGETLEVQRRCMQIVLQLLMYMCFSYDVGQYCGARKKAYGLCASSSPWLGTEHDSCRPRMGGKKCVCGKGEVNYQLEHLVAQLSSVPSCLPPQTAVLLDAPQNVASELLLSTMWATGVSAIQGIVQPGPSCTRRQGVLLPCCRIYGLQGVFWDIHRLGSSHPQPADRRCQGTIPSGVDQEVCL